MQPLGAALCFALLALAGEAGAAPAPRLWSYWAQTASGAAVDMDHEPWERLLRSYVAAGDDGVNRVAYARFTEEDRARLGAYIDGLAARDPRALAGDAQMAYWINLYNAITVRLVLDHPRKDSIRRMGGFFALGPWDEALVTVAGKELTLNDIEHRILRPIFQDHRVHYAVNCASYGCPNLRREAYTAGNLERLLDAGQKDYVNHPRGVDFDAAGRLVLSSIYDWYRGDFADSEAGLLDYLARHHETLQKRLRGHAGPIDYQYDWSLNAAGRP